MQSLQKIYEKPLIQKLGYNHTWPKALCYGHHSLGRIRIPNLYLEQFLQQLNILLRLIKNKDTKNLINNIINTYQLQVGSEYDPLQYPRI